MSPARRYVIIGSGVAGVAAAQAVRAHDGGGEIHLISDDPFGYYSRPGLAYYLSGEITEGLLYPYQKKDFQVIQLRWHTTNVESLVPAEHRVQLANRETITYDRLLIATGSIAIPSGVPGASLQGVVKLDSMEDARKILKLARRAKTAVVVGGGITALELVEGLRAQRLRVHYLLRGERYWSNVLDPTESEIVESRLLHEGVEIHYQTELAEIIGQNGKVTGVRTKDGRVIRCEMVAVAIGVSPRKELAQAAGLQTERGILINEYLQASDPDIFAAGDVAQVFDPHSGKSALDTLWTTAHHQGSTAGANMAGQSMVYWKNVPLNVTRLAGLTTTIIGTVGRGTDPSLAGINRGDSETWRQLPVHSVAEARRDGDRLRLLIGENRLLGAVVMGDQALSVAVQALVAHRVDISRIQEELLKKSQIAETLSTFWNQWRSHNAHARP